MWLLATHLESWSGRLLSTHVARRSNFSCCPNQWDEQRQKQVASHLKAHYWWDAINHQSIYVCSTLINHGVGVFLKSRPVVLSVMSRQNSKRMPSSSVSQQDTKEYQGNLEKLWKNIETSASRVSGRPSPRLAPDDWRSIVQALKIGKSIQIQRSESLNVTECLVLFCGILCVRILALCSCYEWALGLQFLKLKNTKHSTSSESIPVCFEGYIITSVSVSSKVHFWDLPSNYPISTFAPTSPQSPQPCQAWNGWC